MNENSARNSVRLLKGLLLDLEFGAADSTRFGELKDQIRENPGLSAPDGSAISIELDHLHFTQSTLLAEKFDLYDFIILSPQGTPWRAYKGPFRKALDRASELLVNAINESGIAVLGICGGHQFLAMSFGAEVDFIDRELVGRETESYPAEALAERGVIPLEILRPDRIFEGLALSLLTFDVVESHTEEVKNVPTAFVNLARSALSEIQLMTMPNGVVYGMAFHPERGWGKGARADQNAPAGQILLSNFFRLLL